MKLASVVACVATGLSVALVKANIGISPCPGGPYPMCLLNYGKVGSPVWLCCVDSSHTACINYWKQKWLYDNAPGDPATYGYSIISTTDKVNLNCDPDPNNTCY